MMHGVLYSTATSAMAGYFPVCQIAQSPIHTGLEHFQECSIYKFSGQPGPVSHQPHSEGFLPDASLSLPSLSLLPGCLKTGSRSEPSVAELQTGCVHKTISAEHQDHGHLSL